MEKKKSIGSNILIIVLIFLAIASVCGGLFAWAKYQSTIQGTAMGETAKWSFKVSDGDTSTQDVDFPMTRTDNNTSVAEGKIVPGTYGELEIVIDATGTETALTYVIEATMENLPTNLKFYADEDRTLDLTVLDNKFSKGGYMKLNEVGARTEKIYWEWPFETTTKPVITDEKITALGMDKEQVKTLIDERNFAKLNDMIDTAESNKQISMSVSVTGKQLNEEPRLADLVQVGDYVNYNAADTVDGQNYRYTTESSLTGSSKISTFSSTDTFNNNAKAQWRVLSVDKESGNVELISVEETSYMVVLLGSTGFRNSEKILNDIGDVYGHGKGAKYGRNINLEDIEQYSSYEKTMFKNEFSSTGTYGGTRTYNTGSYFLEEIKDEQDNVIGYGENIISAPVNVTSNYYGYTLPQNYISNSIIYNMIFNKESGQSAFWLASRCVLLKKDYCYYALRDIRDGAVVNHALFSSKEDQNKLEDEKSHPARPVVGLDSNIKTTGQDENGVWQLDV